MSKAKSSKNRTVKITLLVIVVTIPVVIIASCVYLYFFTGDDISPKDSPINPLPAYPAATAVTATNVSRIEQEIKGVGDGWINYEFISDPHYQVYVTTDTVANIGNFYNDDAKKAGLTPVAGGGGNNYSELFAHDKAFSFPKQYVSGFAILWDVSYSQLIAQWIGKQPTVNTKIIVLFQGLAYSYYG